MESECARQTTPPAATPRIYVASLADYNAGCLHGSWIDAAQPLEAIQAEVTRMLGESTQSVAEEWAIHDYENFGDLHLSEYENLEHVAAAALLIVEHGPLFGCLASYFGGLSNLDEARRYMEEGYRGVFDSLADYAQELVEDCYGDVLKSLPDFIRYHIDYEGIGDDIEMGGDVFSVYCDGKLHVFDAQL